MLGRRFLLATTIFSPCGMLKLLHPRPSCVTSGFLIKSINLAGVKPTPTTALRDASLGQGLYDVLGGTTLQDLVEHLEKYGRAVMNLGGFTGMTSHITAYR